MTLKIEKYTRKPFPVDAVQVTEDNLAAGRLVPLLEGFAGRSRGISLVYPPSRQYSPKLMAFAEALANARW